ncbi:hypothetical protein EVAR_44822_1 [Eumeta japonica]|uniref:Uncharacterized protein n=1 Tax=Eumeta variegata TaxID=151549 RepID=A0A4C1X734_EUMVA|nr:hypothetical protein EVAR_44822_1 [Eumeta japonica]
MVYALRYLFLILLHFITTTSTLFMNLTSLRNQELLVDKQTCKIENKTRVTSVRRAGRARVWRRRLNNAGRRGGYVTPSACVRACGEEHLILIRLPN